MCLPRPDSPPVLGDCWTLTAAIHYQPDGVGAIILPPYRQNYIPNTNILTTTVALTNGDAFQITDFCPSTAISIGPALFRRVEPPPVCGWDRQNRCVPCTGQQPSEVRHPRGTPSPADEYVIDLFVRGNPRRTTRKFSFGLTWGLGIEDDLIARLS